MDFVSIQSLGRRPSFKEATQVQGNLIRGIQSETQLAGFIDRYTTLGNARTILIGRLSAAILESNNFQESTGSCNEPRASNVSRPLVEAYGRRFSQGQSHIHFNFGRCLVGKILSKYPPAQPIEYCDDFSDLLTQLQNGYSSSSSWDETDSLIPNIGFHLGWEMLSSTLRPCLRKHLSKLEWAELRDFLKKENHEEPGKVAASYFSWFGTQPLEEATQDELLMNDPSVLLAYEAARLADTFAVNPTHAELRLSLLLKHGFDKAANTLTFCYESLLPTT